MKSLQNYICDGSDYTEHWNLNYILSNEKSLNMIAEAFSE